MMLIVPLCFSFALASPLVAAEQLIWGFSWWLLEAAELPGIAAEEVRGPRTATANQPDERYEFLWCLLRFWFYIDRFWTIWVSRKIIQLQGCTYEQAFSLLQHAHLTAGFYLRLWQAMFFSPHYAGGGSKPNTWDTSGSKEQTATSY